MEEVKLIFISINEGLLVNKELKFIGIYNRTENAVFVGGKWNDNFVLPKELEWCKIIPFKGAVEFQYIDEQCRISNPSLLVDKYMDSIL